MITSKDLSKYIGQTCAYRVEGMTVYCRTIDARIRWGQVDVLLVPIEGAGERWTPLEKVSMGK